MDQLLGSKFQLRSPPILTEEKSLGDTVYYERTMPDTTNSFNIDDLEDFKPPPFEPINDELMQSPNRPSNNWILFPFKNASNSNGSSKKNVESKNKMRRSQSELKLQEVELGDTSDSYIPQVSNPKTFLFNKVEHHKGGGSGNGGEGEKLNIPKASNSKNNEKKNNEEINEFTLEDYKKKRKLHGINSCSNLNISGVKKLDSSEVSLINLSNFSHNTNDKENNPQISNRKPTSKKDVQAQNLLNYLSMTKKKMSVDSIDRPSNRLKKINESNPTDREDSRHIPIKGDSSKPLLPPNTKKKIKLSFDKSSIKNKLMQVLRDNKHVSETRHTEGSLADHSFAVDNMYENVSIEISKIELTTDERSIQGGIQNMEPDNLQLTSRFNTEISSSMLPINAGICKDIFNSLKNSMIKKETICEDELSYLRQKCTELLKINDDMGKEKGSLLEKLEEIRIDLENLTGKYKALMNNYLCQTKEINQYQQLVLDLNQELKEKNSEIYMIKSKTRGKESYVDSRFSSLEFVNSPDNINLKHTVSELDFELNKLTDEYSLLKSNHVLVKKERDELSKILEQQKLEIKLLRDQTLISSGKLTLSNGGNSSNYYELQSSANSAETEKMYNNFYNDHTTCSSFQNDYENLKKDLEVERAKLRKANEIIQLTKGEIKKFYDFQTNLSRKMYFCLNEIENLKNDLLDLRKTQEKDHQNFKSVWPHLLNIFNIQNKVCHNLELKCQRLENERPKAITDKALILKPKKN